MKQNDKFTSIDDCISVTIGSVESHLIEELEKNEYDQAVVRNNNSEVIGLVERNYLTKLMDTQESLKENDPNINAPTLNEDFSIHELYSILSSSSAALIANYENGSTEFVGLITIADLNRPAFRSELYLIISNLEIEMSKLIRNEFKDKDAYDWIAALSDDAQAMILGYWELSKRKNVDIGPEAGATITHLISVINKTELRKILGFNSGNQYSSFTGAIPEFRNRVMHPVRPLVLGIENVQKDKETIDKILSLYKKINELG